MVDFSDALDKVQKVMDKDTKYQKECDDLLDLIQDRDERIVMKQTLRRLLDEENKNES